MVSDKQFVLRTVKWLSLWICLLALVTVLVSLTLGYEPALPREVLSSSLVRPDAGFVPSPEAPKSWGFAFFTLPLWIAFPLAAVAIVLLELRHAPRANPAGLRVALSADGLPEPIQTGCTSIMACQRSDEQKVRHRMRAVILWLWLLSCVLAASLWLLSFIWTVSYSTQGVRSQTYFRVWMHNGVLRYSEAPFPFVGSGKWDVEACSAWQALLAPRASAYRFGPATDRALLTSLPIRYLPFVSLVLLTAILFWVDRQRWPKGHCQACGYDLTANTSGICPECGTPQDDQPADAGRGPTVPAPHLGRKRVVAAVSLLALAIWAGNIPWTVRRAVIDYVLASGYAKQEFLYHRSLAKARAAIAERPPALERAREAAFDAWNAWGETPEVVQILNTVDDLGAYAALLHQGDAAMDGKQWTQALEAYGKAQQLIASPEAECKSRLAHAYMLLDQARHSISTSNWSRAENELRTSLWYVETSEAPSLLEEVVLNRAHSDSASMPASP